MSYDPKKSLIFRGVDCVQFIPAGAIDLVKKISQTVLGIVLVFWGMLAVISYFMPGLRASLGLNGRAAAELDEVLRGVTLMSLALFMGANLVLGFVRQRLMRLGRTIEGEVSSDDNYLDYLDFEAARIFKKTMARTGAPFAASLLINIIKGGKLDFSMRRLCVNRAVFEKMAQDSFKVQTRGESRRAGAVLLNDNANKIDAILASAIDLARRNGEKKVTIFMLFLSLMAIEPAFKAMLDKYELLEEDVESTVVWQMRMEAYRRWRRRYWERDNLRLALASKPVANLIGGYTVTLDRYSRNLSGRNPLHQGGVVLHQKEIEELEEMLCKENGNGILLVGETGCGRKSIVYNFANRVARENSPGDLRMLRILELDMVALIGTYRDRNQLGAVLETMFMEAVNAKNVVLVIPQINNYFGGRLGTGEKAIADMSGVISQFLKMRGFRLIGITTYDGLHNSIESAADAAALFTRIEVAAVAAGDAMRVLKEESLRREKKNNLFIPITTLKEIVKLCDYFLGDHVFPLKAVNLLDEVIANRLSHPGKLRMITPGDADRFFSRKYEVPAGVAGAKEKEILLNLEERIHEGLVNQKEAVGELANALRRARAEIKKRKRTIGNFLFLGPTGSGKTETAKQLARVYFGSGKNIIKLNMAEYQTIESVNKLLGNAAAPGWLTTAVRENPFSLILVDEVEKADNGVLDLFLSIFDEGELTDGNGKIVDFRHTIIIATSNAGAEYIKEAIGHGSMLRNLKEAILDNLMRRNVFKPEFLNRFDAIVLYRPLSREEMKQVAGLMVKDIKDRLREKRIELVVNEEMMAELAELGFDPVFGGRAMRRAVQDKIENAVARALLLERIKPGDICEFDPKSWELLVGDERRKHYKDKAKAVEEDDPIAKVLLRLEDRIHEGLIDQEDAVGELANALRRAHANFKERKRAIGSFLFLGPTGCGKTETAKQLARVYFGSESNMIRLDMAEYQAPDSIEKLIGNLQMPGLLTTRVIENPDSLILIDEIEKAIPQVLNIFLSIFDDGRLSDGMGQAVDFKNTIIVATSNAGAEYIKEAVQKGSSLDGNFKRIFLDYLLKQGIFTPEFLNRFDAISLYRPLNAVQMRQVAGLMLGDIQKGLALKGIQLNVGSELVDKLVQIGFDPVFGGRELRRTVQDNVENAIATALLSRLIRRGDIVEIDPYGWQAAVVGKIAEE